ncbi:MAG: hypothetical protein LBF78_02050 [Treponema sp.]|jgi:hypothetical protein|nr:hypothetical protein [Treponema sp.]
MGRNFFCLALLITVFSCAAGPEVYRGIDADAERGDYIGALASLKSSQAKKNIYTQKNAILLNLDRGMLEHYAGMYEESSRDLEEGERRIEEAFTKSLSQAVGTYILNDNVREYSGEDYEDIYINVFNALNYYHLNDLAGAMVEIRRVNEKLRVLADKYETARKKILDSGNDLNAADYTTEAEKFSNSALARFLGVLFYRSAGLYDDARIDMEELKHAYELFPAVYYNSPPSFLDGELSIPAGKARLNVLVFTGRSPVKQQADIMIPLPLKPPNNWARLALPQMISRPSAISSVELILDSGERFSPELIEDMSMVARETFKAKYSLTVLKSTVRTIMKSAASAGIGAAIDEQAEGWGTLFSFVGKVFQEVSEQADIRQSRYFPARAYAGGINVESGIYRVTVNFYGPGGLIESLVRDNVVVRPGKLNLLEAVCLK